MKPFSFHLCPRVSVAETGGTLIFLHERSDRYFILTPFQRRLYESLSSALPDGEPDEASLVFAARLKSRQLIEEGPRGAGLLPDGLAHGRCLPVRPACEETGLPLTPRHIARFIRSLIICVYWHRSRTLADTLDQARRWKAATDPALAGSGLACDLAGLFRRLSPFFFSTHDQCRFRSLLLLKYLACYSVPADWVFGVRASPFAAHCWLESGDLLLNDDPENTRQYSPILRV